MVVCNGCTDLTADVARGYAARGVRVMETPVASKTSALNLGDTEVIGFPRFYVDADVTLPLTSIRRIAARLEGGALAASPVMTVDLRGAGAAVRAYYRIWMRLPYVREGMIGVGVYALSEEGRGRFGAFPDVIADDGYVRMLFARRRARPGRRRAGARACARERLRPRAHQDPKPPWARPARTALPRARGARTRDEVLRKRSWGDRRPPVALAGRGHLRGRRPPRASSRPDATSLDRQLRVGARSLLAA